MAEINLKKEIYMTVQQPTLPNGLRIVTEELPGIATATLGLWVEVDAS